MSQPYVGTYAYDKYTYFAPGDVAGLGTNLAIDKRYRLLYQKGKPLADLELMEIDQTVNLGLRQLIAENYGPGASLNDGFKIKASTIDNTNNFAVTGGDGSFLNAGTLFVDGYLLYLKSDIEFNGQSSSGVLRDDDFTESAVFVYEVSMGSIVPKGGTGTYSTPVGARTDTVFVDLYFAEVNSETGQGSEYEDTSLIVSGINQTSAFRARQVQDVCVIEGSTSLPGTPVIADSYHYAVDANGIYHRYIKVATIARSAGSAIITNGMITDNRTVINPASSFADGTATDVFIDGPLGIGTGEIPSGAGSPNLFVYDGDTISINRVGIQTSIAESARFYGIPGYSSGGSLLFGDGTSDVFISEYETNGMMIATTYPGNLIIDATGVGIGTSSPLAGSYGLHVHGDSIIGKVEGTTDLGSNTHRFAALYMASQIDIPLNGTLEVTVDDGAATMMIFDDTNDFIGIGTTVTSRGYSPRLEVSEDPFVVNTHGNGVISELLGDGASVYVSMENERSLSGADIYQQLITNSSNGDVYAVYGNTSQNWSHGLNASLSNAYSIQPSSSPAAFPSLVISNVGEVGISTGVAEERLHVNGGNLYVDGSGLFNDNVGIGTTAGIAAATSTKLFVYNPSSTGTDSIFRGYSDVGGGHSQTIDIKVGGTILTEGDFIGNTGGTSELGNSARRFADAYIERITPASTLYLDGSLGIGVTAREELDVNGDAIISGALGIGTTAAPGGGFGLGVWSSPVYFNNQLFVSNATPTVHPDFAIEGFRADGGVIGIGTQGVAAQSTVATTGKAFVAYDTSGSTVAAIYDSGNILATGDIVTQSSLGAGAASPTAKADLYDPIDPYAQLRLRETFTPVDSYDPTGASLLGLFCWDDDYIYVKVGVGTGSWKRAQLATF